MNAYIPSKEELKSLIEETIKPLLKEEIPSLIRNASKKQWVSPEELEEISGLTIRSQQHLRSEKRIPYHKEGRKVYYNMNEIEEYMRSNKIEVRTRS
ncbi:hypothetical protein A8B79_04855 [Balneola sp. EhC07]|uniref:helix-turn-helix domain-containing protein n=1 Tax=Balneola sp. EhC07 TaxID=1849360 RepID=UPI0007F3FAFB|nr:helix-turn-helix domain-containing protein [Balneola sp. EhC07]OAN61758.1 hypothetical protein A8B79_04855 [Balneola sp. EhC07]